MPLKIFTYNFINKIDTNIVVKSSKNVVYAAKILPASFKESEAISLTDNDFLSETTNLYNTPAVLISKDYIVSKKCENCSMVIAVYSK
jgi:hypothetical protein